MTFFFGSPWPARSSTLSVLQDLLIYNLSTAFTPKRPAKTLHNTVHDQNRKSGTTLTEPNGRRKCVQLPAEGADAALQLC